MHVRGPRSQEALAALLTYRGTVLLSLGLFEWPWEAGGLYRGTGVRHAPAASGP